MHRRAFLAAALASVPAFRLMGQDDSIQLGLQSYTFRKFNLERTLQFIQKLGLSHAEFFREHIPTESKPEQLSAILKLCKEYGVSPTSFGVVKFTKDHEANRKLFEFGKALGVKTLSCDPDPDSFDSLDKLCEEYKIPVGIHPHGPMGGKMHRWYSAEIIMKAVGSHHPLIGSCLDTGHLIRSVQMGHKLDPVQEIKTMGSRNFGIHLKDHDNQNKTDVICGKGVLDVKGVFQALREVKFQYMVSLEYEAKPENPYDDVAACVEVMKKSSK
jgi:inosose dehydratase